MASIQRHGARRARRRHGWGAWRPDEVVSRHLPLTASWRETDQLVLGAHRETLASSLTALSLAKVHGRRGSRPSLCTSVRTEGLAGLETARGDRAGVAVPVVR
jgi:hypothetical protein